VQIVLSPRYRLQILILPKYARTAEEQVGQALPAAVAVVVGAAVEAAQPPAVALVPEINLVLDQDLVPLPLALVQPADMEIRVGLGILQYQRLIQTAPWGRAAVAQIREAVTAQLLQGVQVNHIK
jgi:hypothetical protein